MASGDNGDSPSNAAIAAMGRGGGGRGGGNGFTVAAPNRSTAFTKYLKQIKYQMLVLVHPQSDENMRLQWGF